ncbi:hypothetical protein Tco_0934372 [Tanacetum coccineum]
MRPFVVLMMSRVVTWCGGVGSGGGGSGGGEVHGGDEMVVVERQPWRCLMVTVAGKMAGGDRILGGGAGKRTFGAVKTGKRTLWCNY